MNGLNEFFLKKLNRPYFHFHAAFQKRFQLAHTTAHTRSRTHPNASLLKLTSNSISTCVKTILRENPFNPFTFAESRIRACFQVSRVCSQTRSQPIHST